MNEELGRLFRKIRELKQISMRKAAGDVVSKSQLSRFELGENDISATKLFRLLNNINVSAEEFIYTFRHFELDENKALFEQAGKLEQDGDFSGLITLYNKEVQKFQFTLKVQHRLNFLALKGMLAEHHQTENMTQSEKEFVTNFLYDMLEWGQYELYIFLNVSEQIDYHICLQLADVLIKRTEFYKSIPENQNLIIMMLRNVTYRALQVNDFAEAEKLIHQFDAINPVAGSFSIKITKKLLLVEYYEKKYKYREAVKELEDIVFLYEKFGSKYYADLYKKELQALTEKIS